MSPASEDWSEQSQRLLRAAEAGQSMALGQLLELFRNYLVSIAREEIRHEIRAKVNPSDLVQETFLEACRLFDQFHGSEGDEVRAWLRGILLNKLRDLHKRYFEVQGRQVGRERPLDEGESAEVPRLQIAHGHSTPSGQVVRQEQSQQLEKAIAGLPHLYQQVLTWRTSESLPFAEIGRRLERSEDAARMLFTRALRQLQQEMGQDDATP